MASTLLPTNNPTMLHKAFYRCETMIKKSNVSLFDETKFRNLNSYTIKCLAMEQFSE